ncbi:hypothetical protein ANN_27867 [Periplaneta americana]|uniref:Uncharacterized protein n=1 Tax=Periplaneta americana TaxID=6978 RepID=A0ABQ8RVH0_PERAM|nr:hypothetical protein ANN_27867 [Periplaneta americana]
MKKCLKGKRFSDVDDVEENTLTALNSILPQVFQHCFQQWKKRWASALMHMDNILKGTKVLIPIEVLMDVIKMESEVDPLAVQPCDDAIKEEANPSPDEENLLDLHVARIKEECVDDSYDHNPEIKFEEIILPNNFPVVKCEPEEELCDLDTVKDELDLEVTAGEKEIFPNRYCPFAYVSSRFPPPASARPSVKAGLS